MYRSRHIIHADSSSVGSLSGRGVGVAVLDTGISMHPDFDERLIIWKDFIHNRLLPYDDSGHGTHVAGIIGGSGLSSKGRFRGIAPGVHLISLKILNQRGEGSLRHTMTALSWILQNRRRYNIRIVNISVCSGDDKEYAENSAFVKKVDALWDSGLVVVAAAGNRGPGSHTVAAPGNSRRIITVGSHEVFYQKNNMPTRSGQGPTKNCIMKPDIVAPGHNIISCQSQDISRHPGYYTRRSGTSMSTPMVSGAIALLLEKQPELTPKKIKIRLKQASTDLYLPHSIQGWGLLSVSDLL